MKEKDSSPKIPQRNKLKDQLTIKEFPWTDKQKEFISLVLNKETKLVFLKGPAGTSKTLISVYCGLKLLNEKRVSDLLYVRTVVESASKGLGFLPGESGDKFKPFLLPLEDKLDELLPRNEIKCLLNDERIQGIPVNYLRGANWNAKFICADESQNFTFKELTTLITRLGQFSKLIVSADIYQADINGNSGFQKMFEVFNDEESRKNGIFCFEFTKDDIVRSGLCKYIIEKLENIPKL